MCTCRKKCHVYIKWQHGINPLNNRQNEEACNLKKRMIIVSSLISLTQTNDKASGKCPSIFSQHGICLNTSGGETGNHCCIKHGHKIGRDKLMFDHLTIFLSLSFDFDWDQTFSSKNVRPWIAAGLNIHEQPIKLLLPLDKLSRWSPLLSSQQFIFNFIIVR